ncbi:hypothetical protein [Burkholderia multivorans]|uniref:hypothetical protein n=1 Tax=Burkholderia multivorans TaxID=87883 RepID=UPI0021BED470
MTVPFDVHWLTDQWLCPARRGAEPMPRIRAAGAEAGTAVDAVSGDGVMAGGSDALWHAASSAQDAATSEAMKCRDMISCSLPDPVRVDRQNVGRPRVRRPGAGRL